jgi:hypothetical protein
VIRTARTSIETRDQRAETAHHASTLMAEVVAVDARPDGLHAVAFAPSTPGSDAPAPVATPLRSSPRP